MKNENEKTLDILGLFRKNYKKIFLISSLFAIIIYLISSFILRPKYESKASLIINSTEQNDNNLKEVSLNDIQVNQKLVNTYTEIIKTRGVANAVIENLSLNIDYEDYKNMVSITTKQNTEVFEIKVIDTIPERAADIVNETSNVFKDTVVKIMKVDNVKILDKGIVDEQPVSPRIYLNTIIAFVIGFFVSIMTFMIKELSDTRIKSSEDITAEFDIPVLGIIPDRKKFK